MKKTENNMGFSGAYVPPMEKICVFCKQKCDSWFKFCPNCGMKFDTELRTLKVNDVRVNK